ncbi:hypothetical protein HDU93_006296, partial [Gonapodya sp. JEL0774]
MRFTLATLAAFAALAASSLAHPGEVHSEAASHARSSTLHRRTLAGCQNELNSGLIAKRALARRAGLYYDLKAKNDLKKRDLASVLSKDHKSTLTGLSASSPSTSLFTSSGTCILEADVTQGPYFVSGEYLRTD